MTMTTPDIAWSANFDRKEVRAMDHFALIQLQLAAEHRQRQIREAAEHRRARVAASRRPSIRHVVGQGLIRLGNALDTDEAPFQPARPR
jgi:hypothetical protein